jgi:hypothetical protein
MIIKNCIFTKSDSIILKSWKILPDNIHTGVDISGNTIFSPCFGVVISILYDDSEKYVIVLQYNADVCIRISNLVFTNLKLGESIKLGDQIGYSNNYVHIEYLLSTISSTPSLCVRVGKYTYYKYNPIDLVMGKLTFPLSGASALTIITPTTTLSKVNDIPSEFKRNN